MYEPRTSSTCFCFADGQTNWVFVRLFESNMSTQLLWAAECHRMLCRRRPRKTQYKWVNVASAKKILSVWKQKTVFMQKKKSNAFFVYVHIKIISYLVCDNVTMSITLPKFAVGNQISCSVVNWHSSKCICYGCIKF